MSADPYQQLAQLIEERRKELGYARVKDFIAAVGKSDQGVLNMRTGKERDYSDDLKWAVCGALQWRRDSIDRVLAGKSPVPVSSPREASRGSRSPGERLALHSDLVELAREVEALAARVARLDGGGSNSEAR